MRARIAQMAKGHAFEDRFLKLTGIPLLVAYRQAEKQYQEKADLIKTVNESWSKKLDNLFKALFMYTNPNMYKAYLESKEMESLRDDVKVEEFPDLWEQILQVIPNEVSIDEEQADPKTAFPEVDPQTEEILAGFVPYQLRKDGE